MASQPQNGAQPRFLGRYELMYLLGQGGMGEVHLARLTGAAGFEKLCIVKTILPQMMTDPQFVDRFHHEAKVLTHLTHSNIAQVYDMGDVDQTLYMAIEYIAGVDLSRVTDRVRAMATAMPIPIAVLVAQQMCEALGYAHRKVGADGAALGIVHRDVSPQNVMVSYEGEVKVIDFGLAKSTARSKHTLPSTVLGKLGYMSPEQAKGETVDHRSDIYSAGIVVWELLTGRSLFEGGTVGEMVAKMAFPNPTPLRSVRPEVSENLERVVMRALTPDPSGRYNRCDDFARALNELLVRENMSVSAEEVGNYVRSMCPEEFAAERHLQSKLSAERKKGGSQPVVQAQPEFAGTMMRTGMATGVVDQARGQTPPPPAPIQLTAAQRAMSGDLGPAPSIPSQPQYRPPSGGGYHGPPQGYQSPPGDPQQTYVSGELKIQKSRGPLIGVVVVLLLIIAGGGAWVVTNQKQDPVVTKADPPRQDPVVAVVKAEPPRQEEPPKQEEPLKQEEPVAPTLERAEIKGEVLAIFRDKGELWVRAGKKVKLKQGDELRVVGPPIQGSLLRDVYGSGSIMEMKGPVGRIDDGVQVPKDAVVFAAIEKGAVAAAKKKGALATAAANVKPDPTVEPAKTEPAKLEEVAPTTTVAKLEDPAPVEPPKPVQAVIRGKFEKSRFRGVMLYNETSIRWNNCEVRLPMKKYGRFENPIEAGESDNIRDFNDDRREPDEQMKKGWGLVRCKEGAGYIWWGTAPL